MTAAAKFRREAPTREGNRSPAGSGFLSSSRAFSSGLQYYVPPRFGREESGDGEPDPLGKTGKRSTIEPDMGKEKLLVSWSGGKDSALALLEIRKRNGYEVTALLTTVTEEYDRVSMHGIRRVLLEQQAESLGYPLEPVLVSRKASNEEWESRVQEVLEKHREQGVTAVVFGDIFLEDLRAYREENLDRAGLRGLFPLWDRETGRIARDVIGLGFRAVVTCVDTKALNREFSGREYDSRFVSELPAGVDPCGENGEFHTFVYDGPGFRRRVGHTVGERVLRDNRFSFCDVLPLPGSEA